MQLRDKVRCPCCHVALACEASIDCPGNRLLSFIDILFASCSQKMTDSVLA